MIATNKDIHVNAAEQLAGQIDQAIISAANTGKINSASENTPPGENAGSIMNTALSALSAATGVIHAVGLQIVIGDQVYSHFHSFKLEQSSAGHHTFILILDHDISGIAQEHNMEEARDYLGKNILLTFKYRNIPPGGPERSFKGIITQVGFSQEYGSAGNIMLTGKSPTILLDGAPHTQSFTGMSLQGVADAVITQGVNDQQLKKTVKTTYTGNLPYTCQYHETHYNYLARMAAAYGEWFFYNGEFLFFGKPALPDPIKLIYGRDTHQVKLQMNTAHTERQHYGYNSSNHEQLAVSATPVNGLGELGMFSYGQSKKTFKAPSLQVAPVRAVSAQDVETTQKGDAGAVAAEMFTLSGNTSIPFLYPGCLIEMNFRKPGSSEAKYFSQMLVTAVSHSLDAKGDYTGHFEAIPGDTVYLPAADFTMPVAEPQIAVVEDNADGQGRVKVKFDWQTGDDVTDWIRMMAPDAGTSGAVSKNRGFAFIPEIGDQVMVGFVHSHPDRPFVMGAMFHGKVGAGGGSDNHLKTIYTRSGNTIQFDDTDGQGSITVQDASGNTVYLDGQGSVTVTASAQDVTVNAPETMTFNAKNLIVNVAENISVNAGMNISTVAGMDIMESAGDNMSHFAINDLKTVATNITHIASENVEHHAKRIEKTAEEIKVESTKESMTINSADTVELRSGKKTKLF